MKKQTYTETKDTITYEGDLILEADLKITKNLVVKGRIFGKDSCGYNIDCWNINCWNINCRNIDCRNIDCWNINCLNINCLNIDCWNINCWNINCLNIDCLNIDCWNIVFCDKIQVKKGYKVICKVLIKDRFNLEKKERKA